MSCIISIPELGGLSHTFPVVRADFSPEALVTEHPVEFGSEVTDHIQVRPLRFVVETQVTASPTIPFPGNVEAALSFLELAQGKLLTVTIDGEGVFSSYALEAWPYSVTVLDGRPFTMRFKQIRIASAISVTIPPRMPAPVAAVGAATEQGLGQGATVPLPTSTLSVAKDALMGLVGLGD